MFQPEWIFTFDGSMIRFKDKDTIKEKNKTTKSGFGQKMVGFLILRLILIKKGGLGESLREKVIKKNN